jgi:hypothetical protein
MTSVSRLVTLTQNPAGTAQDLTLGFAYNPASQISSTTRSTDVYAWGRHFNASRTITPNGLNQLASMSSVIGANSGTATYSSDARGNLSGVTEGPPTVITSYTYSAENLLRVMVTRAITPKLHQTQLCLGGGEGARSTRKRWERFRLDTQLSRFQSGAGIAEPD